MAKVSDLFQYTYRDIPSLTYALLIVSAIALGVAISMNDDEGEDTTTTAAEDVPVTESVTESVTNMIPESVTDSVNSVAESVGLAPPSSSRRPQLGGKKKKNRTKKIKRAKK
jgi:hypothetical protein